MRLSKIFLFFFAVALFTSCAAEKDYLITIETRHGEMVAVLFDDTPVHKKNFIELAESGRFDSTEFQRVMKTFMIQGGDVFTKENLPYQEWPTLQAEIRPQYFHKKGMIAAARQPDQVNPKRESNGSQFYIVHGKVYEKEELITDMRALQKAFMSYVQLGSQKKLLEEYQRLYEAQEFDSLTQMMVSKREELENSLNLKLTKDLSPEQVEAYTTIGGSPHLDLEYTVFGELISGLDVLDKIADETTNSSNRPLDPVFMKVLVEEMSKKEIEKKYSYTYSDEQ